MAKLASIEYTTAQILDIGLTVVRNTHDFKRALGNWETIPKNDKTWDRFKLISRTRRNNCTQSVARPCNRQATITQIILRDSSATISKSGTMTSYWSSKVRWNHPPTHHR